MSKNSIIGVILIAIILFGFSYLNRPKNNQQQTKETTEVVASNKQPNAAVNPDSLTLQSATETDSLGGVVVDPFIAFQKRSSERFVTLKNNRIEVTFSSLGAMPISVQLLQYKRMRKEDKGNDVPLYLFKQGDSYQSFMLRSNRGNLDTRYLHFEVVSQNSNEVVMRLPMDSQAYLNFKYTLKPDDYLVTLEISGVGLNSVFPNNMSSLDMEMAQKVAMLEKSWSNENMYSTVYYKYMSSDVDRLTETKQTQHKDDIKQPLQWIAFKNKFFASVVIANERNAMEHASVEFTTLPKEGDYVKDMRAKAIIPFRNSDNTKASFTYFYGPVDYNILKAYDKGVDKTDQLQLQRLVYVGGKFLRWINLTLIRPLVDWLQTWITSWGIIILVLTIIIKLVLSPLTFKSYLSQAKMRVLKPQVEEINAKYPGNDQSAQMKRTQETMALYRSVGAGPMAGCLPMLLQMPFLIALFRFFPTSIDLRGESFLWADDLSSYDPILSWGTNLPLIGDHISGFCLLWAVTNVIYSRYTMAQSATGQNNSQMKMMAWMPIIMSVMFFFFFNSYSSGLCYYYFISIGITILQFIASRMFIKEDKLLAQLEANKKKPRKKSGFMARLEEAQRKQEQYLREQQKRKK